MRQRSLSALVALVAAPLTAAADPTPPARGHVLIPTIEIRGRLPKPLAAVDVARAKPTMAAAMSTPSQVEKVAAAVDGAPF